MTGSLVSETLLLGILIGAVGVLAIKPLVRLLPWILVVRLVYSIDKIDKLLTSPWVRLVIGILSMCAGVFVVIIFVLSAQALDITYAILSAILTFLFIASGTFATHKAWGELKRNSGTSQTGKNHSYRRIP